MRAFGKTVFHGIYRIDGKTLTLVLGDEKTRPSDFDVRNRQPFRVIAAVKE